MAMRKSAAALPRSCFESSPEMALRLSKALGRSAESWLAMQYNYDLWQAKQRVNLRDVEKVRLSAA